MILAYRHHIFYFNIGNVLKKYEADKKKKPKEKYELSRDDVNTFVIDDFDVQKLDIIEDRFKVICLQDIG